MTQEKHVVSRRSVNGRWPEGDREALMIARSAHDQGLVTMCQGRVGGYILQYAIPTVGKPIKRSPYFSKKD